MQMALARWGAWFRRGWPWWWSVGLVLGGLLALHYLPTTDDNVRRVGMVYETLGMLLVLLEVAAATKKHGLQWPWQRFARYWRDTPLSRRTTQVSADLPVRWAVYGHRPEVSQALGPGASLEQRVAFLEGQLQALDRTVDGLHERADAEQIDRKAGDEAEAAARAQGDNQLQESIKGLEVGSLDFTVFGLLWLFIGMVMTTGTSELCMVLQCAAGAGQ